MTLATHAPRGVSNPAMVASKESALLEFLRKSPDGLRPPEICAAVEEPPSATVDRLRRLLRRGEVEKIGRRWRLPRDEDDVEIDVATQCLSPEPGPEDQTRWVQPISRYVRRDTSEFACRRYG
jgi:hypothetical protein